MSKTRMGRPPLEDGGRPFLLTVKVTHSELEMFSSAAEALGKTRSDWIRCLLIDAASQREGGIPE